MGHNGKLVPFAPFFKIKFLFTQKSLASALEVFHLLYKFNYCLHSPSPWLICWGDRFLKIAAWSRMSNLLIMSGGDDKKLGRYADWEAQVKALGVNFVTLESISQ